MSKLTLVRGQDWEGLYVDGKIVTQGHSIDAARIVEAAGGEVLRLIDQGDEELLEAGWLPDVWPKSDQHLVKRRKKK